jgi:hypothetical protein
MAADPHQHRKRLCRDATRWLSRPAVVVLQTIQWIGGGSLGLAVLVTVYAGAAGRAAPQTQTQTQTRSVLAHAASDVFTAGAVAAICAVLMAATVMTTVKELPPPTRPDSPSRDA